MTLNWIPVINVGFRRVFTTYSGSTFLELAAFCSSWCCLSPQQLLRLQEELKGKELELEQAQDEQRYLEGEIFTLREKVKQT